MSYNFSDPVYKILSRVNGKINNMSMVELEKALIDFHLNSKGTKEILKRRLKEHYKNSQIKSDNHVKPKFPRFFIVIDFEATCDENSDEYKHEIIEFPAILVDSQTNSIIDEFHSYVKPVINPQLSDFCTKLTGIKQETVDESPIFEEVFAKWNEWLIEKELNYSSKFVIVTDGPWDMDRFLWQQCCSSKIQMPKFCQRWINIRKLFTAAYKTQRTNLAGMLDAFSLQFEGTPHCGLHDARNIANILIIMLKDGIIPKINENIKTSHKRHLDDVIAAKLCNSSVPLIAHNHLNQTNTRHSGGRQETGINGEENYWDDDDDDDDDITDLIRYVSLQSR